ncbi:MAG TPA: hypothetical protein VFP19_02930 [Candidatus Limnocylindrales bacterium]|nr:hypothetical protein [Candidatus Limnocylindrales bacterium]
MGQIASCQSPDVQPHPRVALGLAPIGPIGRHMTMLLALAMGFAACQPASPSPTPSSAPSAQATAAAANPAYWVRVSPDSIAQPEGFMEVHRNSQGGMQTMCAPCHPAVDTTMTAVTHGPSGFVAVGWIFQGFHGVAWHSPDGAAWSLDAALPERTVLNAVAADDRRYVAVGLNGTGGIAWTSSDGLSWRQDAAQSAFAASPIRLTAVVHWAKGFAAAGYAGTEFGTAEAAFWWSVDGLTWERVGDSTGFRNARVTGLTAGGPGLIAVGATGSPDAPGPAVVWTSADGRTWARLPDRPAFAGARMRTVTSAPGIGIIAAGEDLAGDTGAVWRSPDGLTWAREPSSSALGRPGIQVRMYTAAPGGPGVVIGGTANEGVQYGEAVIWSSPDGVTWTRDAAGAEFADGELNALWSGTNQLVAVGDRGAPDTYIATIWTGPPAWTP